MAFENATSRIAIVIALVALPGFAHAAGPSARDRESARALMADGDKKLAAGEHAAALQSYKAAHALVGVATTGEAVARAHAAMGRLVEARDAALAVVRSPQDAKEPAALRTARTRADELARALLPRIPSIQVTVSGPPAGAAVHVEIDGNALPEDAAKLPAKVNPGKHVVVASAEHFSRETKQVEVAEGAQVPVELVLRPAVAGSAAAAGGGAATADRGSSPGAPPGAGTGGGPVASGDASGGARPRKGLPTLAYVGGGMAAAGVAVGSIAGILSLSSTSSAKDNCVGNACTPAAQSDIDSALLLANVSNAGFGVAVVGAAIFVVGLLTSDSSAPPAASAASAASARPARIVPLVRADGAVVMGTF